jgi:hypothetical protein
MNITFSLSPVEADALQTAFPGLRLDAAIHRLIVPVIDKTADTRLQRLANEYRALSPADQLEVVTMLRRWMEARYPPDPEPVPEPTPVPVPEPIPPQTPRV